MFKKAVDQKGVDQKLITRIDIETQGVGCDRITEFIPEYIKAPCEKVISGENNSYIVLGRDRPSIRWSGYGGKGDTKCGMIDLVVGRVGNYEPQNDDKVYTDPNFKQDAARIYLTQKGDPDDYFGIAAGKIGKPKARSAVVVKSDHTRIIGRESIKLVTGTDAINSQGGRIRSI